ncbi:MAG: hypothetical protein DWB44_12435 [Chloroflexi bacterium]|nr:hypothetical protein [Chloroflexota bacterium]
MTLEQLAGLGGVVARPVDVIADERGAATARAVGNGGDLRQHVRIDRSLVRPDESEDPRQRAFQTVFEFLIIHDQAGVAGGTAVDRVADAAHMREHFVGRDAPVPLGIAGLIREERQQRGARVADLIHHANGRCRLKLAQLANEAVDVMLKEVRVELFEEERW